MQLSAIPVSPVATETASISGTAAAFNTVMYSGAHFVFVAPIAVWLRLSSNAAAAEVGGETSFYWPANTYIAVASRGAVTRLSVIKHTGEGDSNGSLIQFAGVT